MSRLLYSRIQACPSLMYYTTTRYVHAVKSQINHCHIPACNPQKYISVVLQHWNTKSSHFVIGQCAIRKFHVNVPRRVGHDDGKLPQHGHVHTSQVALHPLQRKTLSTMSSLLSFLLKISLNLTGVVSICLDQTAVTQCGEKTAPRTC